MLDDLAEVHHGQFAGLSNHDIATQFPKEWTARAADKYRWRFPGGESYSDTEPRARGALLAVRQMGARLPLVITHEMIGRILRRQLLGLGIDEAMALNHPQGEAYLIAAGRTRTLHLTEAPE